MKHYRYLLIILVLGSMILLSACSPASQMPTTLLPAGQAYADGKEIFFIHTETSDASLAELLSKMMDSPVLHVPSLGKVSSESLAGVYVFENGIKGTGPLGFQADVFNFPPGTAGYSPLRQVSLVRWNDPATARLLKSEEDILQSQKTGQLIISQTPSVVNMSFVVWDGGKR